MEVEVVERGLGQVAERALGEHGRLRDHVRAGLEVAQRLAVLAAAAVAGADAADDPVLDQEPVGDRLGEDVGALLLGLLGEEPRQLRDRDHVVAVVAEVRRHRLQRQRRLLGQQVDRVLGHLLVGERPVRGVEVREQLPHRRRASCSRRSACARRRPCPSRSPPPAPRRASPSARARRRAGRGAGSRRRGRPGPPPTIATPTSIRSSSGSVGSTIRSRSSNGGGYSSGSTAGPAGSSVPQPPLFALMASVSLGMILCRSPTTPRSANSKIGAFGSLLIARMFSELCIPTLCWIAPEIPAAR